MDRPALELLYPFSFWKLRPLVRGACSRRWYYIRVNLVAAEIYGPLGKYLSYSTSLSLKVELGFVKVKRVSTRTWNMAIREKV